MKATYVLGLIGSVITLVLLFELLRRRHLREKYAIFWVVVALVTIVIAVFPSTLFAAASLVGVEVPANLLFFGASMLLLGVTIHQSYELGRLEERTRTLAEEIGLLRLEVESHHEQSRQRQPSGRVEDSERRTRGAPAQSRRASPWA